MNQYQPTTTSSPFVTPQQTPDKRASVIDLIKHDHVEIERLLTAAASTSTDVAIRQDSLNRALALCSEHLVAEEILVYPTIKKTAKEVKLTEHSLEEHQRIKELADKIKSVSPTDPIFLPILNELIASAKHHQN